MKELIPIHKKFLTDLPSPLSTYYNKKVGINNIYLIDGYYLNLSLNKMSKSLFAIELALGYRGQGWKL